MRFILAGVLISAGGALLSLALALAPMDVSSSQHGALAPGSANAAEESAAQESATAEGATAEVSGSQTSDLQLVEEVCKTVDDNFLPARNVDGFDRAAWKQLREEYTARPPVGRGDAYRKIRDILGGEGGGANFDPPRVLKAPHKFTTQIFTFQHKLTTHTTQMKEELALSPA